MKYDVSSEVMRIRRKIFLRYQLPLYIYIGGIFTLSSIPPSSLPSIDLIIPADKVAHFMEYGIFGFLLLRALLSSGRVSFKWTAILVIYSAAVLGAIDEYYQHLANRDQSVYDWMFDCLGAATSLIFMPVYIKLKRSARAGKSP